VSSPRSKVEVKGFEAKYYDILLGLLTLGKYRKWIEEAVMSIPSDYLREGARVLEFGCGTGIAACVFARIIGDGKYIGVDISEEMLKKARKRCRHRENVQFLKARIEQPLEIEGTFDVIFMSFVMHGLEDWDKEKVLENAWRLLKKDGVFAVFDYAQLEVEEAPLFFRFFLTKIECPLALEFVKMDFESFVEKRKFKRLTILNFVKGLFSLYVFKKVF